jgi:hypothetical protein
MIDIQRPTGPYPDAIRSIRDRGEAGSRDADQVLARSALGSCGARATVFLPARSCGPMRAWIHRQGTDIVAKARGSSAVAHPGRRARGCCSSLLRAPVRSTGQILAVDGGQERVGWVTSVNPRASRSSRRAPQARASCVRASGGRRSGAIPRHRFFQHVRSAARGLRRGRSSAGSSLTTSSFERMIVIHRYAGDPLSAPAGGRPAGRFDLLAARFTHAPAAARPCENRPPG